MGNLRLLVLRSLPRLVGPGQQQDATEKANDQHGGGPPVTLRHGRLLVGTICGLVFKLTERRRGIYGRHWASRGQQRGSFLYFSVFFFLKKSNPGNDFG